MVILWVLQSESQCVCEFQCNYYIHWFVVLLLWVWWVLVYMWERGTTYWAWWVPVGMAGAGCVTLCLAGEPTATVGMAGVSGYAVGGYGGYAGMCASRALAVPPSHPLIPTALHFDPLYFTSRQFFTKAL